MSPQPVIRLLLLALCLARPAAALELKIATWNLEWLTLRPLGDPALPENVQPKTAADRALLRAYALQLDADVVAFQEVDGPAAAAEIFPPDRYSLVLTNDRVIQRVGFAIRNGLPFERNPDVVALSITAEGGRSLRSGADITLVLPGGRLRLLNVHLKTGCHGQRLNADTRNCATLQRQVPALQGWLAQRREELAPFVLLGDLNRRMDGRDDFLEALRSVAPLTRATEGQASPCWGGGAFIDHLLAGGPARAWLVPGSLRVMVYREDRSQQDRLSDHCPVSARFRLPD